ncbi:MAG: hypothetical protein LBE03_00395 [Candidatus Nomurabacteria bacterium]|jgi:hypothetical protein|nr:hypothetical protein [Candidatus Nomurabacteria bacterium]
MNNDPSNQPLNTPPTSTPPTPPPIPPAVSNQTAASPVTYAQPVAPAPAQPVAEIVTTPVTETVEKPKKSKLGLTICLIICALILLGGGVTASVLLLGDKGPKDEDYRKAYTAIVDFTKKQANLEKLSLDALSEAEYTNEPENLNDYAESFSLYVSNFRTMMSNVEATGILKNEILKQKYDNLSAISNKVLPAFEKFIPELSSFIKFTQSLSELLPYMSNQEWLMSGAFNEALVDELFAPILGSNNEAIKQFAGDLSAIYKRLAAGIKDYNDGKTNASEFQAEIMNVFNEASNYYTKLGNLLTVESLMGITEDDISKFEAAATDFATELYSSFPVSDDLELPKNLEILGEKS